MAIWNDMCKARGGWLTVVCALFLGLAGLRARGEVVLRQADLDGDGEVELILENSYLRVELTTGIPPARPPDPGFWRRLRGNAATPRRSKYGTRFVWGGSIHNVVFKPTAQRWFADAVAGRGWQGIPEEFEVAVKIKEIAPDTYEAIKVGVGVVRGTGLCLRSSLKLLDSGTWSWSEVTGPDGEKAVRFRHEVGPRDGYGYVYTKEIRLRPGSSRFEIRRSLVNSGTEPLSTNWYPHAFWGQAARGEGYDSESWSTIPVRPLGAAASGTASVDTARCLVGKPTPAHYWGALAGELVAEPWWASGHLGTQDLFLNQFDTPFSWYRVWTHSETYSCEPFVELQVVPGERRDWTVWRSSVNGLRGIRGCGEGGILDWEVDQGRGDSVRVTGRFSPFESHAEVTLEARVQTPSGRLAGSGVTTISEACSPVQPLAFGFSIASGDEENVLRIEARGGGRRLAAVSRSLSAPGRERASWSGNAGGGGALILAELGGKSASGGSGATVSVGHLRDCLSRAGFTVTLMSSRRIKEVSDWSAYRLVVLDAGPRLGTDAVRGLAEFVEGGGGLLLTGPLNLSPFEFSDLLPVSGVISRVEVTGRRPRDGTREFLGADAYRYHLELESRHPLLSGLPLFPDAYQSIARLQVIEPAVGSRVLLRYASGAQVRPAVTSSALVVGTKGRGRVAVFASPVDWGSPPSWVIWSRLGEYHRKFFAQLALWTAGGSGAAGK